MQGDDSQRQRSIISEALNWLYDRVARDLSPPEARPVSERDIDRSIRLACTQAGAAGFVTNMGGLLTLPVAIPANLAGTAAVQMRLIAKIAAARGYDTQSEEVRTFVFVCLLGNAAADVLKGAGLRLGMRVGRHISAPVLHKLNQTVFARLLARFGTQGAVGLTKVIPIMSGLLGGGLDAASTRVVGLMAKRVFVRRPGHPGTPPTDGGQPLRVAAPPPLAIEAT